MIELQELFDVQYGHGLELNGLVQADDGVNFVSRTAKNNGVSAVVQLVDNITPFPGGTTTVSLGGSVLESFVQPQPFYTGYHIYCLTEKSELTENQKLYYCACIRENRYRYNYGRQANKTLKTLYIPSPSEIPDWVNNFDFDDFGDVTNPLLEISTPDIDTDNWRWFRYSQLFDIKKGKRLTKANMSEGETPFIGAIEFNNGHRQYIGRSPIHNGNTITVNYNGSVAEAFYQPVGFWASDDVNVLYPKFQMNQYIAMFLCCLIRVEKYRYNYGRKWHLARMEESKIKLPVDSSGKPDWDFMENYIKSLPFSSSI